jgi:bacterioferritin
MSKQDIIAGLNAVLTNELTAINQYFLHYKLLQNFGLNKMAQAAYQESIEEMKHAETIMDRIIFLKGKPSMDQMNKLYIGDDVEQILANDLKLEIRAIEDLNKAIKACEDGADRVTQNLLEEILISEDEHYKNIEVQLNLIKIIGIERYCQNQV